MGGFEICDRSGLGEMMAFKDLEERLLITAVGERDYILNYLPATLKVTGQSIPVSDVCEVELPVERP